MRHRSIVAVLALSCLSRAVPHARADSITLEPVKDNTLYEDPDGMLSNGMGSFFFAGRTNEGKIRRGVIAFDVAAHVPAGSTITSVTLTLHMSKTVVGPKTVSLHRVVNDWGEGESDAPGEEGGGAPEEPGDATWQHTFAPTDFWTNDGGDYSSTPSATQSVAAIGFYTWGSTPRMVLDVQNWLNNPAADFGWLVRGDESTPLTAKRFDSKDHFNAALHPMLTIVFTPPAVVCDTCEGDLDGNDRVDAADIQAFTDCYVDGSAGEPDCVCADMDDSGGLGGGDVVAFVDRLLTAPDPNCS